jgi:hypothetical protein
MHILLTPTTPFESKYKEYLYNKESSSLGIISFPLLSTPSINPDESNISSHLISSLLSMRQFLVDLAPQLTRYERKGNM